MLCYNITKHIKYVNSIYLSTKTNKKTILINMKINAMRAFLISALVIIILYTLGLFLPIIMKSKESKYHKFSETELVFVINKKTTSL